MKALLPHEYIELRFYSTLFYFCETESYLMKISYPNPQTEIDFLR